MPQPTTTSSLPQTATTISTTPAVTTTTTTTTTTPAPTCPSNYKWDPNIPFCHKITTDPKESWPNARAACQTVGADLAIIDVSAKFSKILSDRKYQLVKLLGVIEIFEFFNLKVNKLLFIICITFLEKKYRGFLTVICITFTN